MKKFFVLLMSLLLLLPSCGGKIRLPEAEYTLSFAEEYLKMGGNSVKLMYPVVSGYSDSAVESAVNAAAAAIARQRYEEEGLMYDNSGGYTYTATDAVITLASRDFYSVYIIGVITSDVSGGRDTFAYTFNCDMTTASFVESENIVADYDALAKKFQSDSFTADFGGDELKEQISKKSLIEQYKADYGIYPCVYFREGKFGILADTLPSIGQGCAGFSADIRNVRKYLKTDNPVIAALCGLE